MKYVYLAKCAGIDGLTFAERDVPRPGPGEVLVRMRAWSINYRDLLIANGLYPKPLKPGVVALSDGAGEVVDVGDDVTRWALGDRVVGIHFPRWISGQGTPEKLVDDLGGIRDGVLAEYVIFPAGSVVGVPAHLDFAEAATLPGAGVIAWRAIVEETRAERGHSVLTLGSGGVSTFAIQFARLRGAHVIATSSSDEKLERLRQLGAADRVNYRIVPNWGTVIFELSNGGVDHVVEVGGSGTISQSVLAARVSGYISVVGVLGQGSGLDPFIVLAKQLTLRGLMGASRQTFEDMNQVIEKTGLRPVIDRRFGFSEVRAAYRYVSTGAHIGKVVLESD